MKKRFLVFSLLFIAIIQGCSFQDHVLPEPDILPDAVKRIIDERYPEHSELAPGILEKGKIFVIKFSQDGRAYTLISNRSEILEAQYDAGDLPDSLKALANGTVVQGGTFSHARIADELFQPNPVIPQFYLVDYQLNGVTYTVRISGTFSMLMDHMDHYYRTNHAEDLPDKIQQFLHERNKPNPAAIAALPLLNAEGKSYMSQKDELQFSYATGWVLHGGKKYYEVNVMYYGMTSLPLLFDENGDLVWSSSFNFLERWENLTAPTSFASNLLPAQIEELKGKFMPQNLIKDFTPLKLLDCWQNRYAGVDSYTASFEHFIPGNRREAWILRYDAGKNVILRTMHY